MLSPPVQTHLVNLACRESVSDFQFKVPIIITVFEDIFVVLHLLSNHSCTRNLIIVFERDRFHKGDRSMELLGPAPYVNSLQESLKTRNMRACPVLSAEMMKRGQGLLSLWFSSWSRTNVKI